jgi:hypothetical protein
VTQRVSATGYPVDLRERYPAAAIGELSRVNNDGRYQLSMSLNPGNSGGPVVDDRGAIVGVVSARGDPGRGVIGIVLVEPVGRILAEYRAHVERDPPPAPDDPTEREASAFAFEMVLLVGDGKDMLEKNDALARVEEKAARARRPPVMALYAAHMWNALEILLERDGARDVTATSPALRADATHLTGTIRDLCQRADAADRRLRDRYEIVGLGLPEPSAAPPETPGPPVQEVPVDAVAPPPTPRQSNVLVQVRGGGAIDNVPNQGSLQGAMGGLGIDGLLRIMRTPTSDVSLAAGLGGDLGPWRRSFTGVASGDVGVRAGMGEAFGLTLGAFYTPSVVYAEGRSAFAPKAYRASVGMRLGRGVSCGVSWQEIGRGADSPLRVLAGYLEAGL